MLVCDRCLKSRINIHCYCFGRVGESYPGLVHYDLCPDCAKEFAKQFEQFISHDKEAGIYATAEWQERLKQYEEDCQHRGKQ